MKNKKLIICLLSICCIVTVGLSIWSLVSALDFLEYVEEKEATCTQEGNVAYYRDRRGGLLYKDSAGEEETSLDEVTIPKLGHQFDDGHHDFDSPTCEGNGNKEYWKCMRCGKYFLDAYGNKEVEWENIKVPPKGHTYDPDSMPGEVIWIEDNLEEGIVSCKLKYTCKVCEKPQEILEVAKEDKEKRVYPTCTRKGHREYEANFMIGDKCYSYTKLYEQPPLAHDITHYASKPATCETDGNIEYWYCSRCGKYFSDSFYEQEIEQEDTVRKAFGHTYDPLSSPGRWEWFDYSAATLKYTCAVCHKPQEIQASAILEDKKEPTCEESGVISHKATVTIGGASFSDTVEEEIQAKGHTVIVDNAVSPSCTTTGLTQGSHCSECRKTLVAQNEVEALGHDYLSVITEPTFTERGYTKFTCKRCGYNFEGDYVDALLEFSLSKEDGKSYAVSKCNINQKMAVVIPDTYNDLPVSAIEDKAFSDNEFITSIILSANITDIGQSAFSGCTSLISVDLSNGLLNSIGITAFSGDSALKSIYIPESVSSIGNGAFFGCSALKNVIWNSINCVIVGDFSIPIFTDCMGLEEITIGENVKVIPADAFVNCSVLKKIVWNAKNCVSVGNLSNGIFGNCAAMYEVAVGDNVKAIPAHTFFGCSTIKKVSISNLSKWCEVEFGGDFANPLWYGHHLFLASKFSDEQEINYLEIPQDITKIQAHAFEGGAFTSVLIHDEVVAIGDGAFKGCPIEKAIMPTLAGLSIPRNDLKEVVLTSGNSIERYAFSGCSELKDISISQSVTSIEDGAFNDCISLSRIRIPNHVTKIGDYAFQNCMSLSWIIIPASVVEIGWFAFSGCINLRISCEAKYQPKGWDNTWSASRPVEWGFFDPIVEAH